MTELPRRLLRQLSSDTKAASSFRPAGFWKQIAKRYRSAGILLMADVMADEVQTGVGRTGWFSGQ